MNRKIDGAIRFRKSEETEGFSAEALMKSIEEGYLTKRRPGGFTKKTSFAPSSIGYGHAVCPRYWYLAFEGGQFVDSFDAKGLATMQTGTDAHSRLQKSMKDAGILVAEEVELKMADPPIRGYADVLVKIGDESVVGEIKTTSEQIFDLKVRSKKPSVNHLLQILIYMRITNRRKGFLLYENRNTLELLCIEIEMTEKNEEILDNALDWMRKVYKNWQEQTLPTRPYRSQTVKICANCPVNKLCWEGRPEGVVKLPKMEVPTL